MKNLFLFGAAILGLAGCTTNTAVTSDYGYTFDDSLPVVSGTQAQLTAAINATPSGYAYVESPGVSHGPNSQSVVFYEGTQPSSGVVAGTPVWTAPVAATPAPAYIPGAPVVNEPAGAAVGNVGAGVAGAPVAGGYPYYGADGSVFIGGTNANVVGTNAGGINISNANIVNIPTNAFTNRGTNMSTTNMSSITNGFVPTNNVVVSNVTVRSNLTANANTNGTAITPAAGATNNLNNLPRANAQTVGNAQGTQLINQRSLGNAPTPVQSQVANGQITAPTQPGPVTTEAAGASTGTGTGTQTTPQNTTLGPNNVQTSVSASTPNQGVINSGNSQTTTTTTTPAGARSVAPGQRVIVAPRTMQQAQPQAAPAPAPAAPK